MESVHAISFAVKIFSMLGLEVTFSILGPADLADDDIQDPPVELIFS